MPVSLQSFVPKPEDYLHSRRTSQRTAHRNDACVNPLRPGFKLRREFEFSPFCNLCQ
jgi:hypothetical protein